MEQAIPPVGDPPTQENHENQYPYSPNERECIDSIAYEAALLFPEGKQYDSPNALREEVREFADRKRSPLPPMEPRFVAQSLRNLPPSPIGGRK